MKPLSCERCGGPVPLSTSESRACPWCAAPVALDEAYAAQRERLALQARLRREAEPQWAALSRAPPQGVANVSLAALLLAPSIVGMLGASMELAAPKVIGFGILPATLPGAAGWLWAAAIELTVRGARRGVAARRIRDDRPGCRGCGAPLELEPGALAASCGYCGTDSVVLDLAEGEAAVSSAAAELRSVTAALRRRRSLVVVGLASVALLILMGSAAFGLA